MANRTRRVVAIQDCYLEHVYRKAGDEFVYSGGKNPEVLREQDDASKDVPQRASKPVSRRRAPPGELLE